MGCCSSTNRHHPADQDRYSRTSISNGHHATSLFPTSKLSWTSPKPITTVQLQVMRDAFWDTQPAYSGRTEIWQVLKAVCEVGTDEEKRTYLDAANLTIPTGDLTKGCFDELGNEYVIPDYCLCPPTNIIKVNEMERLTKSNSTIDMKTDEKQTSKNDDENQPMLLSTAESINIIARCSTGKDLKIPVPPSQSISQFKKYITLQHADIIGNSKIKVLYLGKVLSDKHIWKEVSGLKNGAIVQIYLL